MRSRYLRALAVALPAAWAGVAVGQCPVPPGTVEETGDLLSTMTNKNDHFGQSVWADGDTLIVGAVYDDVLAGSGGAAHVFRFIGGAWTPEGVLTSGLPNGLPPNCVPGSMFGCVIPEFGESVFIAGDTAVVGARTWQAIDPEGGARSLVGRVFIYRRAGNVWTMEQEITPDGARTGDEFGRAIGLEGNVMAVGAALDDDACVDGAYPDFDPNINVACFQNCQSGAVYIYEFDGLTWNETAKLTASDILPGKRFGRTLALEGNVLAVGAPIQDDSVTNPTCVGTGGTNVTNGHGAVYVFRNIGGTWTEVQKLLPPIPVMFTNFGNSVRLDGGRLYVGAPRAEHPSGLATTGGVFVYEDVGGVWTLMQELYPPDFAGIDLFGTSLDVEGDFMVVGASGADLAEPGNIFCNTGALYAYRRVGGVWQAEAKLALSDAMCGDYIGAVGVAISSGHVATGAPLRDHPIVCCPCNMDGVVGVDVFDLLAFLDFWFRGIASRADFDRNLTVDVFDLLAFLSCWFPATAGDCGEPDPICNSGQAFFWEGVADVNGNGVLDLCEP